MKNKKIKLKGASAEVRASRKRILDAINNESYSFELKDALKVADESLNVLEEVNEFIVSYDGSLGSFTEELTSKANNLVSAATTGIAVIKSITDGAKYIKMTNGFKTISDGYQKFLKGKGMDGWTAFGIVLDVVDGGLNVWENCNTYGKVQANRDAYMSLLISLSWHKAVLLVKTMSKLV